MKTLPLLLCSFLLVLLSTSVWGQRLEQFSENQDDFIAELGKYMTSSKQKVLEENYREFQSVFRAGMFSDEEQKRILQTANAMLSARMSANPYFRDYLKIVILLKQQDNGNDLFGKWHKMLDELLLEMDVSHKRPFQEFLGFAQDFIASKALRYSDGGVTWYAMSDKYTLEMQEGQPAIIFPETDLLGQRKQDSILINNTSGVYYPVSYQWEGHGGKTEWTNLGDESDVYTILEEYSLDTRRSIYEVEKAALHYPLFFGDRLIKGTFAAKLSTGNEKTTVGSFPRFDSREGMMSITNFGTGVEFRGGFRIKGSTIYGYGEKDDPATLELYDKNGKLVYRGRAEQYAIKSEELILGEHVESTLYFKNDSLYHPSVNLSFDVQKREIQLSRGDRGSDRNPFYNSMNQVNIDAETINAFLESDSLVIGKPSIKEASKRDVVFESFGYFHPRNYQRFQNIATVNPLAIMKVTAEKEGTNFLDADMVAKRINPKFSVENIQTLLYDLVADGFINYDSDKQQIEVKDKVFHYVDAARNQVDYDGLNIRSSTLSTNAIMNLKDETITIDGIRSIEFSPAQRVAVKPLGEKVVMQGNRNMSFDGHVYAGYSMMEGKDFRFNYEKFLVELDSVRYFDLFVPTGEKNNNMDRVAKSIASRIEHVNGVLLIDAPNNKSGKDSIQMFPSLQTQGFSYVYYDQDTIQEGAYGRDSFYFQLEPFSFNQLDDYLAEDIKFKGSLTSGGIFPDFKETLVLRENNSLGFKTKTPEEGEVAYGGKGRYAGELDLSNKGFYGRGNMQYLNASIDSEDIIFKPSEATAGADRFDLEEDRTPGSEVPQVRGSDVRINWRPQKDSMYVRTLEDPFKLFKQDDHVFDGTLILTPDGLKGDGTLDWSKAFLKSGYFSFGAFSTQADTTSVGIKALDAEELALSTNNVSADVDFDAQKGLFKANDQFLVTTLPYNQYITSMNEFTWDMKEETIDFKADAGKYGVFTSIHPDQDSLTFRGQNAFYNLKTSQLNIEGVPHIVSADAFIYPDSGLVEIQKGGVMTTLQQARIVADTTNKYHVINRATVEVLGRRKYRASGFYEYNIGDRQQEIKLQDIIGQPVGKGSYSEKKTVTRAIGEVKTGANFYIDHKTQFQGRITLNAEAKNLQFDGFARLDADKLPRPYWFTISSEGDKKDLAIRYDTPKSFDGEPLETGLFLSKENSRIYPRVMAPLHFRKDRPIFSAKGYFKYNQERDQFIFGDSLKVLRQELTGNQFIFKNVDGSVEAEGKFNIGSGLKYIKVDAAGTAKTAFPPPSEVEDEIMPAAGDEPEPETPVVEENDPNMMLLEEDTEEKIDSILRGPKVVDIPFTTDLMAGIQLIVPENLLKIMLQDVRTSSFDAPALTLLNDINFYRKAAQELFPPTTKEMQQSLEGLTSGYLDIQPKYNPYTILFSRLKMKWDPDYQSFVSMEDKNGVISVAGEPINKMLTCHVEFKMPSNEDDRLYIYLKSPSEFFYFFGFKQGILSITSNNPTFMEAFDKLKPKDLIQKMADGETYEIQAVEPGSANLFLRRVQATRQ
ncbi:MAG: hypothetical protein R2824_21660 [Saprospiraceae bacterium]|nr:hypothetical protein [Lewinella sp.]